MINVLVVCTGNTCRSPMGEHFIRSAAKSEGLPVEVRSAGIAAVSSQPASREAVQVMQENGYDLNSHKAERLTPELVQWADMLLVMTDHHRGAIEEAFPTAKDKVFMLSKYAGVPGRDVVDPFGGSVDEYRRCRDDIHLLVEGVIKRLHETIGDDR